jgi:hypothetical protein
MMRFIFAKLNSSARRPGAIAFSSSVILPFVEREVQITLTRIRSFPSAWQFVEFRAPAESARYDEQAAAGEGTASQLRMAASLTGMNRSAIRASSGERDDLHTGGLRCIVTFHKDHSLARIYDVDAFERPQGAFPETESSAATLWRMRNGGAERCMLHEEYSSCYADVSRRHRWIRGLANSAGCCRAFQA